MRATLAAVLFAGSTLALSGCAEKPEQKSAIELKDVPPNVLKVAQEKLPDVKFERAMLKANGDYEVIGKNKTGKVREIDIKPDGTVTEIE